MRLRPKREPRPRPERDLADELHVAAVRLRGWTLSGTTGIDLTGLLGAAAVEVQRLEENREDALSALRYIEQRYGRLDGVGWDRVLS